MQTLSFNYDSPEELRSLLRGLGGSAPLIESRDLFSYSELPGQAPFRVDCELYSDGIIANADGHYQAFLELLRTRLSARFGLVDENVKEPVSPGSRKNFRSLRKPRGLNRNVSETDSGAIRMNGTVKWFNNGKGYGFIKGADGNDYFFHISNVRGTRLPSSGDTVIFSLCEGNEGKPAAAEIEIVAHSSAQNRRPYYGKKIQRKEVVEHGSSKLGSATGGLLAGAMLAGPIGAIIGAVLGGGLGEDRKKRTKQVDITSPCIRCGGKGYVTSRLNGRTGFQCSTCRNFWKVPDGKLPPEDLAALKRIDFTKE